MGIVLALILFSIIVIVHELGHFLLAKKNGITVTEFSLGMGPRILSKQIGETRYSWKLLPLGGSCMMGEDDTEDLTAGSFNSKSVWARMSVIAGGPVFNFILAFVFAVILVLWMGYNPPVVGSFTEGFPAAESELKVGDTIVKMNNKSIRIWQDISLYSQFHQGKSVVVVYEREGKKNQVTIDPKKDESGRYLLGIGGSEIRRGNIITAVKYGFYEVRYWVNLTIGSLKQLVTGAVGIDKMSGPVGIVSFVGNTYKESASSGWQIVVAQMMRIVILLSANLGVFNLLPLPALDGGRLVFLIIEAIRKKRVPPEKEGLVHLAGFVLLMILMIIVLFNDVKHILY